MCGLAGFIDSRQAATADELGSAAKRMADTLRRRGPDDFGLWLDPANGVALAHRRLAIVDLSPHGHQPMLSHNGRYCVVFNGEIYNFGELRQDLEKAGSAFLGHSDTEVLLEAICQWGVREALVRFNGMFAFALWDRQDRCLYLARDRLGEKPLYYGWVAKQFIFASEIKAVEAHPKWAGTVDRGALALFLKYNYVPAPLSIYSGIRKLEPASLLIMNEAALRSGTCPNTKTYWSARQYAEDGSKDPLEEHHEALTDLLEQSLQRAVGLRMVADVPLGAFLSGGIDSSLVVALMQAQSSRPVKTFSIGFHEREFDESEYARGVARHLGTDHTEMHVTPADALASIPQMASLYDEPFSDASQIPTYLVANLARQHVTVALSGDGGDELFGGYNRYFWARGLWNRTGWLPVTVRKQFARLLKSVPPSTWDKVFRLVMPALPSRLRFKHAGDKLGKLADVVAAPVPEEIYKGLVSHWKDPKNVVVGGDEPSTILSNPGDWPVLSDFASRMMFLDMVTYLPDDILVKVDRASMGVSLEARVPLLDHNVVELALRLPIGVKIRGQEGKWLLRQVLYRMVPAPLIERPKTGFGVPIDVWLRGPLKEWASDLLSEDMIMRQGFFDPAPISKKWREHQQGLRNWSYCLWDVLMFQAWLQERVAA